MSAFLKKNLNSPHAYRWIPLIFILIAGAACQSDTVSPPSTVPVEPQGDFEVNSSAFGEGGNIPQEYTCDGADVSPPLSWAAVPEGTQSLVLIADDPDAPGGTWVHWVLYDIPMDLSDLPRDVNKSEDVAGIGKQGTNDFNRTGYGGPCPPPGSSHRYFFKLYALDAKLGLDPGATKQDVEEAMGGHILAQTQLIGRYGR